MIDLKRTVMPKYTIQFLKELQRTGMKIRGPNGLAEQSKLPCSFLEQVCTGAPVTDREHRKICQGLPAMRHFGPLLLEFRAADGDTSAHPNGEASPTLTHANANGSPRAEPWTPPSTTPIRVHNPHDQPANAFVHVDPQTGASSVRVELVEPPRSVETPAYNPEAAPVMRAKNFGEWLRGAREAAGIDQRDLATMIEVTPATISRWEINRFLPLKAQYDKLVDLLPLLRQAPKVTIKDRAKADRSKKDEKSKPKEEKASTMAKTDPASYVKFGVQLGKAASGGLLKEPAVLKSTIDLLRAGDDAGLSAADIATALEALRDSK